MVFKDNFHDISSFGGIPLYLVTTFMFLILGQKEIFMQLLGGLIILYIFLFSIRSIYFKPRPKKIKYKNWIQKIDANSFPSAHALRGIVLAGILANFFQNIWTSTILIIIVLLTGYTRVKFKKHYWSDVVAGWIMGIIVYGISIRLF